MNSRQLVLSTLEFSKPDRVPRNLWKLPWVDMFATEQAEQLVSDFPDDFTGSGGLCRNKSG